MTDLSLETVNIPLIRDQVIEPSKPARDGEEEDRRLSALHNRAVHIFDSFVSRSVKGVVVETEYGREREDETVDSETKPTFEMPVVVNGQSVSATLIVRREEGYLVEYGDNNSPTGYKDHDFIEFDVVKKDSAETGDQRVYGFSIEQYNDGQGPYMQPEGLLSGQEKGDVLPQRIGEIETLFAELETTLGLTQESTSFNPDSDII